MINTRLLFTAQHRLSEIHVLYFYRTDILQKFLNICFRLMTKLLKIGKNNLYNKFWLQISTFLMTPAHFLAAQQLDN